MRRNDAWDRRDIIGTSGWSAAAALVMAVTASGKAEKEVEQSEAKEEVTPPEDLMREHAVLERLLLIYERVLSAGSRPADRPGKELAEAVRLMRTFIEDYHEKLEEDYVFPRFEKAGRLTDLVAVLRRQHEVGREVTDAVLRQLGKTAAWPGAQPLADNFLKYIRMYRPHAARESTVLFPQIRAVATAREYEEMGEKFEEIEHQKFGEAGFEDIVQKVTEIEKSLGIHDLAAFTAKPA